MNFRNTTTAFISLVRKAWAEGQEINPRGFLSKELLSEKIHLERPLERVVLAPHRLNNIFLSIAETLWVMKGRNDLEYLSHYLPRAHEYSDDGKTWRGAYGPRLRNWKGQDQFSSVISRLEESDSKRAVMMIFDPKEDNCSSNDIPCTNWLQFLKRGSYLHLNVTMRANDLFWGFSGINTFEWSVLLEMMAFWTRSKVGSMTFFVGSLHYYQRHFERVEKIVHSIIPSTTLYEFGFQSAPFSTNYGEDFERELSCWFELESQLRVNAELDLLKNNTELQDPFLFLCLKMVQIYNAFLQSKMTYTIDLINQLPESDFRIAAIEYFYRKSPHDHDSLNLSAKESIFFENFYHKSVFTY
jgi:thymidylate synthase